MTEASGMMQMEDFVAHALAIDREATTRYRQLAERMAAHDCPAVAGLFEGFAASDCERFDELAAATSGRALAKLARLQYRWSDPQSAEATPLDAVHGAISPREALEIALANEERAWRFFEGVAAHPENAGTLRALARRYARAEEDDMEAIERMLGETREPARAADCSACRQGPVRPRATWSNQ
jgi:rubrerythrin